tara:strand:+ start:292 stop:711 length:420 start_codon:yes stop_codon:yes gene_type:complete
VLRLAKRANRASATDVDGGRTNLIHLKHAEGSILWEQTPAPFVAEPKPKQKAKAKKAAPAKPKPTKEELSVIRKAAGTKGIKDLDRLVERIDRPMTKSEIYRIGEANGHGSEYLLRKNWSEIEGRLVQTKNQYLPKTSK